MGGLVLGAPFEVGAGVQRGFKVTTSAACFHFTVALSKAPVSMHRQLFVSSALLYFA
jgi:hypothetical protein